MLVGGEKVSLGGRIGRDVLAGAGELEVASTIGSSLTTYTKRMTLLAPAHVAGDVRAHGLEQKDHVVVSPGAVIGGELVTELEKMPHQREPLSDRALLRLAAAVVRRRVHRRPRVAVDGARAAPRDVPGRGRRAAQQRIRHDRAGGHADHRAAGLRHGDRHSARCDRVCSRGASAFISPR